MNRRLIPLAVLVAALELLFVALGVWQLERHSERVEVVAEYTRRLAGPAIVLDSALLAAGDLSNTPVTVRGSYDFDHEFVLVNRTRNGAPGVYVITPLRREGNDTAVLVNRGWVYSPDGSTVDPAGWRVGLVTGGDSAASAAVLELSTLAVPLSADGAQGGGMLQPQGHHRVSRLSRRLAEEFLPYPVAPLLLQLLPADTIVRPGVPVAVPPPALGKGPHMSYAVQWFAFAIIGGVGFMFVVRSQRSGAGRGVPDGPDRRTGEEES